MILITKTQAKKKILHSANSTGNIFNDFLHNWYANTVKLSGGILTPEVLAIKGYFWNSREQRISLLLKGTLKNLFWIQWNLIREKK